jgi:hypothetical protein
LRVEMVKLPLVMDVSAVPGVTVSAGAPLRTDILLEAWW